MKAFLMIILCFALLANQSSGEVEMCHCHGKIYTKVNGVAVDSFYAMDRLAELKKVENSGQRVKEKEDLILIMKYKHCKK